MITAEEIVFREMRHMLDQLDVFVLRATALRSYSRCDLDEIVDQTRFSIVRKLSEFAGFAPSNHITNQPQPERQQSDTEQPQEHCLPQEQKASTQSQKWAFPE